jgi:hypothetical protein
MRAESRRRDRATTASGFAEDERSFDSHRSAIRRLGGSVPSFRLRSAGSPTLLNACAKRPEVKGSARARRGRRTELCRIGMWRGQLADSPFASIEYREETGSTNADAAELLGDDSSGGHTIVAEFQRHGAGRKGRAWHAMPGTALLFSTILPRSIAVDRLWLVPFWVALAVRAGLRECGVADDAAVAERSAAARSQAGRHSLPIARDRGNGARRLRHRHQRAPLSRRRNRHRAGSCILRRGRAGRSRHAPGRDPSRVRRNARDRSTMPAASCATGRRPPRFPDGATESRRTTHESPSRQSRSRSTRAAAYACPRRRDQRKC